MLLRSNKFFLIFLLILISLWRITLGDWEIPLTDVIRYLFSDSNSTSTEIIVIKSVRLPRLLCSITTGALLSVSGVIFQGLLANPLAEPYTLGIAAGAAFGASIGIIFNFMIMPLSFMGALTALFLTALISFHGGNEKIILAGVISNSILSAGVTFLKATAGEKIGSIVLWLMGSFSGAGTKNIFPIMSGLLIIIIPAYILAPYLDAMSLGKNRAAVLGVNENLVRRILLITTSIGISFSVSSFGIIGFVGLVVPHISRSLTGASHRNLIIHSALVGAIVMTLSDGAAQKLNELPVGVLTAMFGGIFFCWILSKK
ncbi:MAG: iron ABC transporter permease [Synergistaceae bacterium]|nr:iron ABC transporter permease [Synergistaceae bacterium]